MKNPKKVDGPYETAVETLARRALGVVKSARTRQAETGRFMTKPPISDMNAEFADLETAARVVLGEDSPIEPGYVRTYETGLRGIEGSESRETHESFAVIRMGRMQSLGKSGYHRMFGSSLDMHPTVIEFTIRRAARVRESLDNARYYALHSRAAEVCTVRMTIHQFAELISGTDGMGVPCTLKVAGGVDMENVPDDVRHEHEEIIDDIRELIKKRPRASRALEQARAILEKSHIGKGDRKELGDLLQAIADGGMKDLGFYMERFNEGVEKVRSAVRADIEGTLDAVMRRLGEKALANTPQEEVRAHLTGGKE